MLLTVGVWWPCFVSPFRVALVETLTVCPGRSCSITPPLVMFRVPEVQTSLLDGAVYISPDVSGQGLRFILLLCSKGLAMFSSPL